MTFRLQFYCNRHSWLAQQLTKRGIGFRQSDNVFLAIDEPQRAQRLIHAFSVERLHRRLTQAVRTYCLIVLREFARSHWSVCLLEFATDLMFRTRLIWRRFTTR